MTTQEFSNQFDTLTNAHFLNGESGKADIYAFDEYEKSLFLTEAQEEIIIELYSGKNPFIEGFEKTEEIRRYLGSLVKTITLTEPTEDIPKLTDNSVFFNLPEDILFITYEAAKLNDSSLGCLNDKFVRVIPVTQDDFHKALKNPFKGPSKNKVLRLDVENNTVELISEYNISQYLVRYLKRPNPIILVDLQDLSINGINSVTECDLNPIIHRTILERAVQKAISSRVIGNNRSE